MPLLSHYCIVMIFSDDHAIGYVIYISSLRSCVYDYINPLWHQSLFPLHSGDIPWMFQNFLDFFVMSRKHIFIRGRAQAM